MIVRMFRKPSTLLRLGMLFLILASVSSFLLRRSGIESDGADLGMGLLYGLAIGTLMLFLIRRRGTPRD